MKTTATQITSEGQQIACDTEKALTGYKEGQGVYFLTLEDYETAQLSGLLDRLQLTPFARNRVLKQGEITKVVPLAKGVMVDLRVHGAANGSAVRHVAYLMIRNLVVRLDPAGLRNVQDSELELLDASATGLLMSALLMEAKRVSLEIRRVRSDVFRVDERMDRDPAGASLDEILDLKDRLLGLLSVAVEQLECFEAITTQGSEYLDFSNLNGSVRLLLFTGGSSERMAERIEKRITDLRQRYDAHQQEKLNHRLAVLTIISAIFLPLTLIAGIWGMNFESMPELKHPLGYPLALTAMVGIAGVMLWHFHRKGWFD